LAGFGQAGAAGQGKLYNMLQDHRRAMSGDFDSVVGCVRVRLGKISNDNFIDAPTLTVWGGRPRSPGSSIHGKTLAGEGARPTWFHQLSQYRAPRFEVVFQAQHGQSNAARFRSREPDDADAATTRRGGNGDDGVVEIHREIVSGGAASNDCRVIRHLGTTDNFIVAAINKEVIESRTEWEQK